MLLFFGMLKAKMDDAAYSNMDVKKSSKLSASQRRDVDKSLQVGSSADRPKKTQDAAERSVFGSSARRFRTNE